MMPPLFIIGNPRSGTSLLRLILTNNSKVIIPPECGFIIWLHKKYAAWSELDNKHTIRLSAFIDDLLICKKIETWHLCRNQIKNIIHENNPMDYAELCACIFSAYANNINQSFDVWGDKNNFHINHLDELNNLYPKARFIHIVRDGRDVACSYREVMRSGLNSLYAPKLDTDITAISTSWTNNVIKTDTFMNKLPLERAKTIRYEDLVSKPTITVNLICEWLRVPFEKTMLNFYQENIKSKLEPLEMLAWKKRTLTPISNETVNRYSVLLSEDEQNEFNQTAYTALKKFHYIK